MLNLTTTPEDKTRMLRLLLAWVTDDVAALEAITDEIATDRRTEAPAAALLNMTDACARALAATATDATALADTLKVAMLDVQMAQSEGPAV